MADQAPNVFSEESTQTPQTQSTQAPTNYADLLVSIQNEQGLQKYDSVEKALEGLQHSQTYIPQLKTQLSEKDARIAELEAKLNQSASLEEVVSRLQQQNQPQATETPSQANGLDPQAVEQLVRSVLQQDKALSVAQQNQAQVNNAIIQKFGDKAQEVIAQKAKELGTTPKQLGELASQSPQMVLALFNTSVGTPTFNTSSLNTTTLEPERKPLSRPEKSLLSGATSKEQRDFMQRIKEEVRAKYNITE